MVLPKEECTRQKIKIGGDVQATFTDVEMRAWGASRHELEAHYCAYPEYPQRFSSRRVLGNKALSETWRFWVGLNCLTEREREVLAAGYLKTVVGLLRVTPEILGVAVVTLAGQKRPTEDVLRALLTALGRVSWDKVPVATRCALRAARYTCVAESPTWAYGALREAAQSQAYERRSLTPNDDLFHAFRRAQLSDLIEASRAI